ncbi:MAG: hypothetical protein ACE37H_16360 [Phycisphaeraceae bacterium]
MFIWPDSISTPALVIILIAVPIGLFKLPSAIFQTAALVLAVGWCVRRHRRKHNRDGLDRFTLAGQLIAAYLATTAATNLLILLSVPLVDWLVYD